MNKLNTFEINEDQMDLQANIYADKYSDQIDAYQSMSLKSLVNESVSPLEIITLGQQLDQFNSYASYIQESQGSLASLGTIPQVALDVITASMGNSIMPLVASIQPIQEEHGIVWYKQICSAGTAGGYTAGDVISDPLTRDNMGTSDLGAQRKSVTDTTTDGIITVFNQTGLSGPIRPYTVEITVLDTNGLVIATGKDNGSGALMGTDFKGTVDYTVAGTNDIVIDFGTGNAPATTDSIVISYDVDVDAASSLDKIEGVLISKDIRAEVWALAADVGTLTNFLFNQRFGRSASDETAQDLANEITRVLNGQAVKRLNAATVGNTNWNSTPASGTYAEHKLTFIDGLAEAEGEMHLNSGIGASNRIIAGRTAAAKLRGMPEFVPAAVTPSVSVALFGTYGGIPVIRATGIIPDAEMIIMANPDNYFNSPIAYSPFMPMLMTDTVQSPNNPLRGTQAAAIWAGLTTLNSNLTTRLTITT